MNRMCDNIQCCFCAGNVSQNNTTQRGSEVDPLNGHRRRSEEQPSEAGASSSTVRTPAPFGSTIIITQQPRRAIPHERRESGSNNDDRDDAPRAELQAPRQVDDGNEVEPLVAPQRSSEEQAEASSSNVRNRADVERTTAIPSQPSHARSPGDENTYGEMACGMTEQEQHERGFNIDNRDHSSRTELRTPQQVQDGGNDDDAPSKSQPVQVTEGDEKTYEETACGMTEQDHGPSQQDAKDTVKALNPPVDQPPRSLWNRIRDLFIRIPNNQGETIRLDPMNDDLLEEIK